MKNLKSISIILICVVLISCGHSQEEIYAAKKAKMDSITESYVALEKTLLLSAQIDSIALADAEKSPINVTQEANFPEKTLTNNELKRIVQEDIPELDFVFNFENVKDRATSLNHPLKRMMIIESIKNGYHVNPILIGVPKYTCKRCYNLISKNLFKRDISLSSIYGEYEKCSSPDNRILR
jgi:hypothetical protein